MHGAREAVEEAGLDAVFGKELANVFEGVDGVLHGLRREAVMVQIYNIFQVCASRMVYV